MIKFYHKTQLYSSQDSNSRPNYPLCYKLNWQELELQICSGNNYEGAWYLCAYEPPCIEEEDHSRDFVPTSMWYIYMEQLENTPISVPLAAWVS